MVLRLEGTRRPAVGEERGADCVDGCGKVVWDCGGRKAVVGGWALGAVVVAMVVW